MEYGNLYASLVSTGGDDDDYCECKSPNATFDCEVEEYRKIRSCSGNFCSTCSLVMVFLTDSGE